MRASRLLSILMLLQARGPMSATALAQALEVSARTVLRDVDELSAAGMPIWSERGRNGGFQLKAGWSTQLTGLTHPEVQALFLAGLPVAATELGLGASATTARLKMIAALPADWRDKAHEVASRLHVDPVDWYRQAEAPAALQTVASAVWRGLRIRLQYKSWHRTSTRDVEPLGLVLKAGAWYLVARPSGTAQVLTFRVANVLSVQLTDQPDEPFKRPQHFDLATHWQAHAQRFESQLFKQSACIAASARAQTWFENGRVKVTALPSTEPDQAVPAGWKTFLLPIESLEHGVRQLLGFGAEVKLLGPPALQTALCAELKRVGALYEAGSAE